MLFVVWVVGASVLVGSVRAQCDRASVAAGLEGLVWTRSAEMLAAGNCALDAACAAEAGAWGVLRAETLLWSAMSVARRSPAQGAELLALLFRHQWDSGQLPWSLYLPVVNGSSWMAALEPEWPPRDAWGTNGTRAGSDAVAPYSGLAAPPLVARAALTVLYAALRGEGTGNGRAPRPAPGENAAPEALTVSDVTQWAYDSAWPALRRYQGWLREGRSLELPGAVWMAHPWESVLRASPAWTAALGSGECATPFPVSAGSEPESSLQRPDRVALSEEQRATELCVLGCFRDVGWDPARMWSACGAWFPTVSSAWQAEAAADAYATYVLGQFASGRSGDLQALHDAWRARSGALGLLWTESAAPGTATNAPGDDGSSAGYFGSVILVNVLRRKGKGGEGGLEGTNVTTLPLPGPSAMDLVANIDPSSTSGTDPWRSVDVGREGGRRRALSTSGHRSRNQQHSSGVGEAAASRSEAMASELLSAAFQPSPLAVSWGRTRGDFNASWGQAGPIWSGAELLVLRSLRAWDAGDVLTERVELDICALLAAATSGDEDAPEAFSSNSVGSTGTDSTGTDSTSLSAPLPYSRSARGTVAAYLLLTDPPASVPPPSVPAGLYALIAVVVVELFIVLSLGVACVLCGVQSVRHLSKEDGQAGGEGRQRGFSTNSSRRSSSRGSSSSSLRDPLLPAATLPPLADAVAATTRAVPGQPRGRDLGDAMPSDVSDTDGGSDGSGADETDDEDERPVRTGKPAGNDEEEEDEEDEDEDDFRTAKSGRSRRSHKSRRTRRTQQDREGADARSRASMSSWVTAADLEHGRAGGAHDSASYADRSELAGEAAEGGNPLGFLGSALGYLLGLQAAEDSEYDAAADDDGRASRASLSHSVSSAHSLNY